MLLAVAHSSGIVIEMLQPVSDIGEIWELTLELQKRRRVLVKHEPASPVHVVNSVDQRQRERVSRLYRTNWIIVLPEAFDLPGDEHSSYHPSVSPFCHFA